MNIFLSGVLWVAGAAVVAGVTAYLVRRFGLDEGRPGNNDAAGQVFTIVAGLHVVLVAFVLISLYDAVSEASDKSYEEADGLVAVAWAADSLPEPVAADVRRLAAEYASTVATEEWPKLREGESVPRTAERQLEDLRAAITDAEVPDDDFSVGRKTEAVDKLWEVYQARQARLNGSDSVGVGAVVWFVLIAGSVITVLLPNLFGGTKLLTHVIIVSTLAGTITLLLFAIYQLQNPFGGGARVEPEAFRWAVDRLA
ncbi:bestrophin-like domain [Amycolatopsis magusensis]|uniref:bestrophin-like domain n=1 Tax=Amycolatopsis magusensis TaxID=882444 RepID=UPI00379DC6C3